jgi:hypothetical protein
MLNIGHGRNTGGAVQAHSLGRVVDQWYRTLSCVNVNFFLDRQYGFERGQPIKRVEERILLWMLSKKNNSCKHER